MNKSLKPQPPNSQMSSVSLELVLQGKSGFRDYD